MEPITTILGGIIGIGGRLLPEIFKLLTIKKDQDHEYRMTQLQLEIDKTRAQLEIDKIHANEALEAIKSEMYAFAEAIKGQSQLTNIKWIDAVNHTVRPFCTYWWMLLLTIYKITTISSAQSFQELKLSLWTQDDHSILSMILGFWFVDRALKYIKRT